MMKIPDKLIILFCIFLLSFLIIAFLKASKNEPSEVLQRGGSEDNIFIIGDICSAYDGVQQEVTCLLSEGTKAIDSDVQLAIELLRLGIKRLGEEYYNENYIDDTGMKLGLAKIKYEEANFKSSADLYKGVLESRLDMFNTLHLK